MVGVEWPLGPTFEVGPLGPTLEALDAPLAVEALGEAKKNVAQTANTNMVMVKEHFMVST